MDLCNCLVPTIPVGNPQRDSSSDVHLQAERKPKSRIKLQETLCHGIVPTLQLQNSQQHSSPVVHLIAHDTPMIQQDLEGGQTHRTNEHLQLYNWSSSEPSELDKTGKIIELSNSSSRFSILAKSSMRNITKS
jgi:hypothetical protein